jgi:hypothetical protein
MSITWVAETVENGRTIFRIGRHGEKLVAEWPGLGRLLTDRTATQPEFRAEEGADATIVEKIQAGAVRGLLRHLEGKLAMHASAIARNGAAVAFIGDSGAGKSTIAHVAALDRAELLSDDCLFIEDGRALPTENASWLDRPGGKQRIECGRVAVRGAPLRAFVRLVFEEGPVSVRRLTGYTAADVLSRAMVRFVMDEPAVLRADTERLAQLTVPVVQLSRPRGFEHLPATLAAIDEAIGW